MVSEFQELKPSELLALLGGETRMRARLAAGERLRATTPLRYPGRRGAVVVYLTPGTVPAATSPETPETPASSSPPVSSPRPVRISDGGDTIKSLDEQGMDLSIDMILSKTVFHAVKQHDGAGVAGGEVFLDSTSDTIGPDLWRFLQVVCEVIGLRNAKYKDALVQLSRRQEAAPDLIGWEGG